MGLTDCDYGIAAIRALLQSDRHDIHAMSLQEFDAWAQQLVDGASDDPHFVLQTHMARLRAEHAVVLEQYEDQLRIARQAYDAWPQRETLERLDKRLDDLEKAVTGLTAAVAAGTASVEKLNAFQIEQAQVVEQRDELVASADAHKTLTTAVAELEDYCQQIGLLAAQDELRQLNYRRGLESSRLGDEFQDAAKAYVIDKFVPRLGSGHSDVRVLSGVTLGCARAELDHVVVADWKDEAVVLGVVEVKRNVNDLASGFLTRQENIHWFSGDPTGYDPGQYRTRVYRHGHFSEFATHHEAGDAIKFSANSFRLFHKAVNGYFLDRLCLVTRQRPLDGLSRSEFGQVLHQLASLSFPLPQQQLASLRRRLCDTVSRFQSRDVLRLYAETDALADQILFLE